MVTEADSGTGSGPGLLLPETTDRIVALAGALADRGHTTRIYAPAEAPAKPKRLRPRVTLQPVPLGDVSVEDEPVSFGDQLSRAWRRSKPELSHVFGPRAGMAVAAARQETPVPVIQDTRYDAPEADGDEGPWARLELALGRAADRVLVPDSRQASRYIAQGVPRTAIDVVPYAVDLDVFTPEGAAREHNGKPRVALLLAPADGTGLLAVREHLPDAEVVLLDGAGDLPDSVDAVDVMRFGEAADAVALAELLRSVDVLVAGADWATAGPVCEEAMACGVPVVMVSDGGAEDDAVLDGVTGTVVPANRPRQLVESVWQLLHDDVRRSAFGIAAADRAASCFSWARVVRDMEVSYDSAVSAGRFSGSAVTGSYAHDG